MKYLCWASSNVCDRLFPYSSNILSVDPRGLHVDPNVGLGGGDSFSSESMTVCVDQTTDFNETPLEVFSILLSPLSSPYLN